MYLLYTLLKYIYIMNTWFKCTYELYDLVNLVQSCYVVVMRSLTAQLSDTSITVWQVALWCCN